jgi:hypothetical protein
MYVYSVTKVEVNMRGVGSTTAGEEKKRKERYHIIIFVY